ncbi:MAG: hypothetical protein ACOX0H_04050 [Patescibacteria group bacterium]|jgi:hypothetical protein|nr:hypothetical protein [bacterium]HQC50038.1 hypothetical protein [bacterium]
MKSIFGIPGITGDIPEVPKPHEGSSLFMTNSGHSRPKTKKSKRQKSSEIYLRLSRRSLPAQQRQ